MPSTTCEDASHRLDEFGWLDRDAALNDGVIDQAAVDQIPSEELRSDIGISHSGYPGVQQLRDVHALPHHHRLITLFEHLLDGTVFVHPRHIVRVMTSRRDLHPTPPHQDFPLIQGTEKTLTCWIPLGDCSFDLGPLTICEGSHAGGYRPVGEPSGAGGITVQRCDDEIATENWRRGEFLAGDVLIFTVMTVHRALPARRRDRAPPLDGHPLPSTHRADRVAVARKPPRTPMGRRVRELGRQTTRCATTGSAPPHRSRTGTTHSSNHRGESADVERTPTGRNNRWQPAASEKSLAKLGSGSPRSATSSTTPTWSPRRNAIVFER